MNLAYATTTNKVKTKYLNFNTLSRNAQTPLSTSIISPLVRHGLSSSYCGSHLYTLNRSSAYHWANTERQAFTATANLELCFGQTEETGAPREKKKHSDISSCHAEQRGLSTFLLWCNSANHCITPWRRLCYIFKNHQKLNWPQCECLTRILLHGKGIILNVFNDQSLIVLFPLKQKHFQ